MRLYFIRHGESFYNKKGIIQGHLDIPLSPNGIQQARETGVILGREISRDGLSVDAVYSSDLKRARQTAEQITEQLEDSGFKPTVHYREDLREIMLGDWEGKTKEELLADLEEDGVSLFQKWLDDLVNITPPGAESMPELFERAISSVSKIVSNHQNNSADEKKAVLIVTHGGILSMIRNYIYGKEPGNFIMFAHPNAGGFALDYDYKKTPDKQAFQAESVKNMRDIP